MTAYSPLGSPHTAGFFNREGTPVLSQVGGVCLYRAVHDLYAAQFHLWGMARRSAGRLWSLPDGKHDGACACHPSWMTYYACPQYTNAGPHAVCNR